MLLIFPRLARLTHRCSSRPQHRDNHQGLVVPMPSPSRKILGSLDRSNMHTRFLESVRGHLGLAQPHVPSRAYRNRSPMVTKGRTHQLRSCRCEPTAQCKQLPDTGRQYSTAERRIFHQQQQTTRRQQRHARLRPVSRKAPVSAGCRQHWDHSLRALVLLPHLSQ